MIICFCPGPICFSDGGRSRWRPAWHIHPFLDMNVGIRVRCYVVEENWSVVTNSNINPLKCQEFNTKHLLILISTVPRNTTTFATRWYVYCKGKLALFACIAQETLLGSWKTKICINFKEMNQDIIAFCRYSHWACPFPSPLLPRRPRANLLGLEQGPQSVGYAWYWLLIFDNIL